MKTHFRKLLFSVMLLPGLALAQDNDFLEDYSILGKAGEFGAAKMYVAAGTPERMKQYTKVTVS